MTKAKIVFQIHKGLYLWKHGYTPMSTMEEFDGDLEEIIYDIPHDSDTAVGQGSNMKRYIVVETEIPDYITSVKSYITNWSAIREFEKYIRFDDYNHHEFTTEMKKKLWEFFSENLLSYYGDNSHVYGTLFAIDLLLKVKSMRSEFRLSLRNQAMEWIRGNSQYKFPFSPKQLQCALQYNDWDFKIARKTAVSPFIPN